MLEGIQAFLRPVNESKLLVGMVMIFLNVSSKYIDFGFSKTQEQILRQNLAREMLIFAVSFMGTRDIATAIILTASFTVLSNMAFNEKSKYCVIPNKMRKIQRMIDSNEDGFISMEEEKRALDVLEKAKSQRLKEVQGSFISYMNTYQDQ